MSSLFEKFIERTAGQTKKEDLLCSFAMLEPANFCEVLDLLSQRGMKVEGFPLPVIPRGMRIKQTATEKDAARIFLDELSKIKSVSDDEVRSNANVNPEGVFYIVPEIAGRYFIEIPADVLMEATQRVFILFDEYDRSSKYGFSLLASYEVRSAIHDYLDDCDKDRQAKEFADKVKVLAQAIADDNSKSDELISQFCKSEDVDDETARYILDFVSFEDEKAKDDKTSVKEAAIRKFDEKQSRSKEVLSKLAVLDEKQRKIIGLLYGFDCDMPKDYIQVAEITGMTVEDIKQTELAALTAMKQ